MLVLAVSSVQVRALIPVAELVVNGGFDVGGFAGWDVDSSSILSNIALSAPNSAHLTNGKSRFTQDLQEYTPAACYVISFRVKNAPDQVADDNSMDVQFNHDQLLSNDNFFSSAKLPLKNKSVSGPNGGWAAFIFYRCITRSEADATADLRLRFHGEGFLVDNVSVIKIG